jgi:putative mRNA 3-end processing factor
VSPAVTLRDGVELALAGGETVLFDGAGSADTTVLSHAHGDHVTEGADRIVASELTAALAAERVDGFDPTLVDPPHVDLVDAGHVAGSRAAVVTDPDTGRRYCYTGDCSTRDRFYLQGFEPPDADVLVIESTYGRPEYVFPPTDQVVAEIHDWLEDTMSRPVLLFGYALGRAQKLQRVLADSARSRTFVTDAVADLNTVIETHRDVAFPAERYGRDVDLQPGDALVLPMGSARLNWIQSLVDRHDARTAGFSGWAVDDSFVYRRELDAGFVLSDHCDFTELVDVVRAIDPERVYTQHGAADELAAHLTSEYGYESRALKENQSTLGDFG